MNECKLLLVIGLLTAASLGCACCNGADPPNEGSPRGPAPILPSGPVDDCKADDEIASACVCGGSVFTRGFCCDGGFSFSACSTAARYVLPDGAGTQDGSDWANALGGLPATLERDTVYWLGAGDYGSYVFDDRASADAGVTIRKATAAAHGTDSGWSPAFGDGQAELGTLQFEADRYTLDGGEPNGFRAVGQMGTKATVQIDGSYVVLRHVEIDGGFEKANGTQTAGGCNGSNVEGDHVVFDRCEVHDIADDGLGIYANHVKVLRSVIHDLDGCGTDGGCGPCNNGHSDGLEISRASDIELVGNLVYDVRSTSAIFMEDWGNGGVSDLVAYNNVFYTPATGITVYLKDLTRAKIHNNVIWGRTQGSRFGGLAIGKRVTGLALSNNIILNINYSHLGSSHDATEHALDYNLFGMINAGEYTANLHDTVADPGFARIPMSGEEADHVATDLTLDDFVPAATEAIDTGTTPVGIPAYDLVGRARPQGEAWDRGPFEALP